MLKCPCDKYTLFFLHGSNDQLETNYNHLNLISSKSHGRIKLNTRI